MDRLATAAEKLVRDGVAPRDTQTGEERVVGKNGGASEDRTPDLVNAIHALSRLSYGPKKKSAC